MTLSEQICRERFTIIPRASGCFTVWDNQHDVERGLYATREGAERRIGELENAGSVHVGRQRKRNDRRAAR